MRKLTTLLIGLTLLSHEGLAQTPFEVERQIFQSNPAARTRGNMANSLLAMSLASLGSVMLTTCRTISGAPLPDSVRAFSNTAFAYVTAEISEANRHQSDIAMRNATVQSLAQTMKQQGGGEVQKMAFDEARIERRYLQNFIGMRRMWISALILGFTNAASTAAGETTTNDTTIVCTGTLTAARTVASQLSTSFNAVIGPGPSETVSGYLNDVLDIVAGQMLPLSETPEGRTIVASIGADAATGVLGELGPQYDAIGINIDNISEVLSEFESSNGVAVDTGVTAVRGTTPVPAGQTAATANPALASSGSASSTPVSGSASLSPGSATGSAAINIQAKTCAEKSADGKSFVFKEICGSPVSFPLAVMKNGSITTKSAMDLTIRLANALASGDVAAAKVAATSLSNLAAQILTTKTAVVRNRNPMRDLDSETKKAIVKLTSEITTSVTKKGGEKLLASSAPAMIPTPKTVVELPPVDQTRDLPARLRGKYFVAAKKVETLKAENPEVTGKPKEENASLWQRLTNRYQLHYDKFLEKKEP